MTQYDLTPAISKHLDKHLIFPLLEFLGSKGLYDVADIEAGMWHARIGSVQQQPRARRPARRALPHPCRRLLPPCLSLSAPRSAACSQAGAHREDQHG